MHNSILKNIKQFVTICFAAVILQISLLAQPVLADDACDDLWFSRNFYFDKAGYCFGSNLGKSVFDNSNCKSKNVVLSEAIKLRISQIKQTEKVNECKVDSTKARQLDISIFAQRNRLSEQPINHGFESSCFGFQGQKPLPLYAAKASNSKVVGYVKLGDNVFSDHSEVFETKWWFASVTHKDGVKTGGWTNILIFDQCDAVAG